MATLSVDTRTQNIEIVFKSGSSAELDLLLEDSQLQVHEKWWDFRASHKDAPCLALSEDLVIRTFSCDHVINEVYDLVLVEINKERDIESGVLEEKDNSLRLRVSERLRQMPRMIDIGHGDKDGKILVSWTGPESSLLSKLHHLNVSVESRCIVRAHAPRKGLILLDPRVRLKPGYMTQDNMLTQVLDFSEGEILLSGSGPNVHSDCGCPERVVLQRTQGQSLTTWNMTTISP
jgi:hypothetical protein